MTTAAPRRLPPLPERPSDQPAPTTPAPRRPRWLAGIALLAAAALVLVLAYGRQPARRPAADTRPSSTAAPILGSVAAGGGASTSSPAPAVTVQVTRSVVVAPRGSSAPGASSPTSARARKSVPQQPAPHPVSSTPVVARPAPSPVTGSASAAFSLTCPVATTLTATGSGAGSNSLSLTGPGVHRTAAGRSVSFTVQVQAGRFTATDTDSSGQPSVGLRQSVPAPQACHS